MTRQLALFSQQPASSDDLDGASALASSFNLFADHLRADGKSEHTVKAFLGDMRLLAQYAGGELPINQLRNALLADFLKWMEHERGQPCSRKTYARRVTTLKVYCKWLGELKVLPDDPARSIRQRSGPAPLSNVLTEPQVRDCIQAARQTAQSVGANDRTARQDVRPEFLLRLLLQTGIKKAECGRLILADIDQNNPESVVVFVRHKARNVYKARRIALDVDAAQLLRRYLRQYQPTELLFTCTTRNLEYILTDIGAQAQVPFKLSFEALRWTMALREYLAGVDEDRIRQKLGLSRQSWYETGAKIRRLAAQSQTSPDL
jgi:integrase/recombinase XerD